MTDDDQPAGPQPIWWYVVASYTCDERADQYGGEFSDDDVEHIEYIVFATSEDDARDHASGRAVRDLFGPSGELHEGHRYWIAGCTPAEERFRPGSPPVLRLLSTDVDCGIEALRSSWEDDDVGASASDPTSDAGEEVTDVIKNMIGKLICRYCGRATDGGAGSHAVRHSTSELSSRPARAWPATRRPHRARHRRRADDDGRSVEDRCPESERAQRVRTGDPVSFEARGPVGSHARQTRFQGRRCRPRRSRTRGRGAPAGVP